MTPCIRYLTIVLNLGSFYGVTIITVCNLKRETILNRRVFAIITAGFLTVSIAYSIRYGYGMLLPEMLPVLGISKTQAGGIFAIYFIVYTLCTPALGALSDYFSYRIILTIFTAILATGALLMAFVSNFIQASLFFSIAGFGHAACWAPVVVLVQKWVPNHRRGTALSFVSMGVGSGIFLWGLLLPVIVSSADWQKGWLALGGTGLVIALLNFILVRNPVNNQPEQINSKTGLRNFLSSYRKIFRQAIFWKIGLSYLFVGFSVIIFFTFLPVYTREKLDVAYAVSTSFISVIAFFGILGQMLLGPLSDKVGRGRVMTVCSLILAGSGLGVLFSESTWSLYVMTGCYGVGYGAVWPVYAAAASDLFPKNYSGGVVGLWTVFLGVGSIIAPVICGWLIDSTGNYSWVFLLAMLAGTLSALLLLTVPKFGIE